MICHNFSCCVKPCWAFIQNTSKCKHAGKQSRSLVSVIIWAEAACCSICDEFFKWSNKEYILQLVLLQPLSSGHIWTAMQHIIQTGALLTGDNFPTDWRSADEEHVRPRCIRCLFCVVLTYEWNTHKMERISWSWFVGSTSNQRAAAVTM